MSPREEVGPGLYVIRWVSGGESLAAIGIHHCGARWIAPINWTSPRGKNPTALLSDYIEEIMFLEKFV